MDQAQERRCLSATEMAFKVKIKDTYLGLLAIEKMRARQRAGLTNIRFGDTSTKYFFLKANGRKRKKAHTNASHPNGFAINHEDKEREVARHFGDLLGTKQSRAAGLNWDELECPSFSLEDLEAPFTDEEIKSTMFTLPKENAPGPDGFIWAFYSKCWETVKGDVIAAIIQISQLRGGTFILLNRVNIVLLLKKEQVERVADFRPISFVHNVVKLLSKMLANRLTPRLQEMVSSSQSAFVKK
jgi:hypothetical protein